MPLSASLYQVEIAIMDMLSILRESAEAEKSRFDASDTNDTSDTDHLQNQLLVYRMLSLDHTC